MFFDALADAIALECFYQDNLLVEPGLERWVWADEMGEYILRLMWEDERQRVLEDQQYRAWAASRGYDPD
jgi:hypothetical protein